jgi:hypothetical protein
VIADIEDLAHDSVKHSKDEHVRREGDKVISTDTVEVPLLDYQSRHGRPSALRGEAPAPLSLGI